jgi:uncharacterized protein
MLVTNRYFINRNSGVNPFHAFIFSDLHLNGQNRSLDLLRRAADIAKETGPSIVIFLGDLFESKAFHNCRLNFRKIKDYFLAISVTAPSFAVLGNHDHELGPNIVEEFLRECNFCVLKNQKITLTISSGSVIIYGFEDELMGSPSFIDDQAELRNHNTCNICLAHNPASFHRLPKERKLVMLSGHTHGGQIRLPFFPPFYNASSAPLRWTYGQIEENGNTLLVTSGLGASGFIPFRVGISPEVVVVRFE